MILTNGVTGPGPIPDEAASSDRAGEEADRVSDVSVRVRISDFLTDRRYAICVDRRHHGNWIIDVDDARQLHRDLGEALDALTRLGPELGPEQAS
jgi:hypothetical protein